MSQALSVEAAQAHILSKIPQKNPKMILVEHSLGHIIHKDIHAPTQLPPFANSAMDGFAVRVADVQTPGASLKVTIDVPAGSNPQQSIQAGEAARIMTGAPLPPGADAIVPIEATDATWQPEESLKPGTTVTLNTVPKLGDNIRQAGENIKQGDLVLNAKTRIRPQDIGMLLGLGITEISVFPTPSVTVLSTGDELIPPGAPLSPGKIRDTNTYTIAGLVQQAGGNATRFPPARDTLADVRALFRQAIQQQPDLIISTAGVSVGTFDVVRTVLEELGAIQFWRVNVRPGKPLAFGLLEGIPFFGLPGNPVSAMVTFDLFVRPILMKMTGQPIEAPHVQAITGEIFTSDGRRTYVRVRLTRKDGKLVATSTGNQSSGALMSMVLADGLMIIPEGQQQVPIGTSLKVRLLRDLHFNI